MIIKIKEVNLQALHHDAVFVLVGKRRTGKTTWGKKIVHHLSPQIGRYCLIAGNKDVKYEWGNCISPLYVTPREFGEAKLEELKKYQEDRVCLYTRNKQTIPYKYRVCVILDDCGSDVKFMKSAIIRDILANGRHYGMFTMIMVQYYYQIPRRCRENIDYLGLLRTNNQDNLRKIHAELCGHASLRAFKYCSAALTNNFGLLFINNTSPTSTQISDSVFYKNSEDTSLLVDKTEHALVTEYGERHSRRPKFDHTLAQPPRTTEQEKKESAQFKFEFKDRQGSVLVLKIPHAVTSPASVNAASSESGDSDSGDG
jgi:hypothetical protein